MTFDLSPRKIFKFILLSIVVLTIANLMGIIVRLFPGHGVFRDLIQLFDFNSERNIPTLYSSINLMFSAVLLVCIALKHKAMRSSWFPWMGLAAIFCLLSVDETAQLHERLAEPVQNLLNISGAFYYVWTLPYILFLGVLFLLYLRFLKQLPKRTRTLFLLSGALFIFGAIGFEIIGNFQTQADLSQNTLQYRLLYTCEEFLEMSSVALFIYALFDYIIAKFGSFSLHIHPSAEQTHKISNLSFRKSDAPLF